MRRRWKKIVKIFDYYRRMKTIRFLLSIFQGILIAFILMIGFILLSGRLGLTGPTRGYIILSGSMEPAVPVGSIVFVREQEFYTKGDIITYSIGRDEFVTHRIASTSQGQTYFGDVRYATKGDANKSVDQNEVTQETIRGKVFLTLPYLGYVSNFAKSPQGFVLLIIVPATIIIYEEFKSVYRELKRALWKFRKKSKEGSHASDEPTIIPQAVIAVPILAALLVAGAFTRSYFTDKENTSQNILGVGTGYIVLNPPPLEYSQNLYAQYKADALNLNDGGAVSSWTDSSGNGRDISQPDPSKQPVYARNILSGYPVVRFDGSDDYLSRAGFPLTQPYMLFVVFKLAATGPIQVITTGNISTGTSINGTLFWQNPHLYFNSGNQEMIPNPLSADSFKYYTIKVNGPSSYWRINGASQTGINPGMNPMSDLGVGIWGDGQYWLNGDIAELLFYSEDMSDSNRDIVEQYLRSKYGL
jgi:signal peptidase